MNTYVELVTWYLVFVFSTTCHEAAHAWVAYRGGDLTAHADGHVSLDPLPHIRRSPFGMVVIPIVSFLLAGWMIGWASVPLNADWARRYPKRAAWMAFAGPGANFLLALIAFGLLRGLIAADVFEPTGFPWPSNLVGTPGEHDPKAITSLLARVLSITLGLNVLLGVFNLIPVPGFDGAAVLEGASPRTIGSFYAKLREIPAMELLALLVAWRISSFVTFPAVHFVSNLL